MTRDLVLVSANLSNPKHSVTRLRQQWALRRILKRRKRPGVICTQESHPDLKAPRGYRKYTGKGGVSELAIFVRNDLHVVDHGWKKSVDGLANHWPDRGLVWVQLADGTVPICVHPNSGIDAGGTPRTGTAWKVTEGAHFPDVDAEVERHVAAGRAPQVVGDWNVDSAADRKRKNPGFPYARFRRLRMAEALYRGDSLGGRKVDRLFYRPDRTRVVRSSLMDPVGGFDHRWLVVRSRRKP